MIGKNRTKQGPCETSMPDPLSGVVLEGGRVLLSGSRGMLGRVIGPCLSSKGYDVRGFDLDSGDICDVSWLEREFSEWRPDIFCNCAAYTRVDDAERNQESAFRVNGDALAGIAALCAATGAVLVHFSTDYVFDGCKRTPYVETDEPNPLSVYGRSKWKGEQHILDRGKGCTRFFIIRTSWLYGLHGPNFIATILDLAAKKTEISVVHDQKGTPTSCRDLSEAVLHLLRSGAFGVYHFSGEGSCTWYEIARASIELAERQGFRPKTRDIKPITTEEFNRPAPRPSFSVMDKTRYKGVTCAPVPHWLDSLEKFIISTLRHTEG